MLTIRVVGEPSAAQLRVFSSARLRVIAPETMNVEVQLARSGPWAGKSARGEPAARAEAPALELPF